MSSLAATQADGYYLPPEYYDSGSYKKVSKNKFAGSKGHNQFVVNGVLRFALPYKGVCTKCGMSIGSGTRYNAKKIKTDQEYLGIPVWEFVMKCRTVGCEQEFQIRTNPQEEDYDYVGGITLQHGQVKQKLPEYGTTGVESKAPLDRLESVAHGKRKIMSDHDQLKTLHKLNETTSKNDADCNALIRSKFRVDRKNKKSRQDQAARKGWKAGMELLAPSPSEFKLAKKVVYGKTTRQQEQERWSTVRKTSIFTAASKTSSKSTSSHAKRKRYDDSVEGSSVVPYETVSASPTLRTGTTSKCKPSSTSSAAWPDASMSNNDLVTETVKNHSVPHQAVQTQKKMGFYTLTQRKKTSDSGTSGARSGQQTSAFQAMLSSYGSDSD